MTFKNSRDDYVCWKCGRISAAHETPRMHRWWCQQGYVAEYWIDDRWVYVHGHELKWTILIFCFLLIACYLDFKLVFI